MSGHRKSGGNSGNEEYRHQTARRAKTENMAKTKYRAKTGKAAAKVCANMAASRRQ